MGSGYVQLNMVGQVVGWSGGYGYVQLNMVRQVGSGYVQLNMVGQVVVWSGGQWVCTVEYGRAGGSVVRWAVGMYS